MGKTVSIDYQFSEASFCESRRLYLFKSQTRKLDGIVLMIMLGLIVYQTVNQQLNWLSVVLISVMLVYLALFGLAAFLIPRIQYRKESKFRDHFHIAFDNAGISIRSSFGQMQLDWSYYQEAWQIGPYYYLFYGKAMYTTIPRVSFKNDDDEAVFCALLREKIDREIIKK